MTHDTAIELDLSGLRIAPPARYRAEEIPQAMVAYVRSICRQEWVAQQVLERAATKVLRRIRHDTGEARRARWATRWRPQNQAQTARWLIGIRDELVRQNHLIMVDQHRVPHETPESLRPWEPDQSGELVIHEPAEATPGFGTPSYLEQTPLKVLRWVRETWRRQAEQDLIEPPDPTLWDLTAGSGTGADYFGDLLGCRIISTDLTPASQGICRADCRNAGKLQEHGRPNLHGLTRPEQVVGRPDLILFDPSAPGSPLHSEVYGAGPDLLDLGLLTREAWIIEVADVAAQATQHLAPGGFVSLLLRCGFRAGSRVVSDPSVLEDFREILGHRAHVEHEMPLHFEQVRAQATLGISRVPAVHLMLRRPA